MSKGDFLRALYDEKDLTWYTDREAASQELVQEGGELKLVLLDAENNRIAVAQEFYRYQKPPYVEFYDMDGRVPVQAYIEFNLDADPNIAIYSGGSKVKEFSVERIMMNRILANYRRETGTNPSPFSGGQGAKWNGQQAGGANSGNSEDPNTAGNGGRPRARIPVQVPTIAVVFLCTVILGIALHILFGFFYYDTDTVFLYTRILCVFASCPIMALLFFVEVSDR